MECFTDGLEVMSVLVRIIVSAATKQDILDIIQFSGSGPGKLILAPFFCAVHCDQPLGSQLRDSEMLFIFQTIQLLEFLLSSVCKLGMNRPRQGCFRR